MSISRSAKKFLYRHLSFERYLLVLSRLYFCAYRLGLLRSNPKIQYPYFLRRVVRPGDVVLDIGANLGYYTCLFARWVGKRGKVYAVEPVAPVRRVLERNASKYSQVEILPFALGTSDKSVNMGNDSLHRQGYVATGSHFVMESPSEAADMTFDAEMRRGSTLFGSLSRLDFIKCDVEGYELSIIPEMQELIRRHTPHVLIETDGGNRLKIKQLLQDIGYNAYILRKMKLRPLQEGDTGDILFIHPQRMAV